MRAEGTFAAAAAIRESRAMRLEDLARNTRIARAYLRAIEEMNFGSLPGGVYNVSYIRQYARAVGVDEDDLVSAYFELAPDARPVVEPSRAQGAVERVAVRLRNVRQKALAALARVLPH